MSGEIGKDYVRQGIGPMVSIATAENSTTLEQIRRRANVFKILVTFLGSLGGLCALGGLALPFPPWNFVVAGLGVLMLLAGAIVGVVTNTLTPEQLDGYLSKMNGAETQIAAAIQAAKKP